MLYIILIKVFEKVTWKHYIIVTLLSYGKTHIRLLRQIIVILTLGRCDKYTTIISISITLINVMHLTITIFTKHFNVS